VRGLKAITALATAPDGKVWVLAQSYVMSFDPATGLFSNVRNAFPDLVYGTSSDDGRISALDAQMVTAPDGQIYGAIHQAYLFRLDPRTGTTTILRKGTFQEIALDGYGNVYSVYGVNHILRYVPRR
jgi:sugar lactone lactonase YvrE